MFFLKDASGDKYSIYDTFDNTVDLVDKKDILFLIDYGVQILGCTPFSSQWNVTSKILIRLQYLGKVYDFDGYLLNQLQTRNSNYQIFKADEIRDKINSVGFKEFIRALRIVNNIKPVEDTGFYIAYDALGYDDNYIEVRERNTNKEYDFDLFDIISVHSRENKLIDGLKYKMSDDKFIEQIKLVDKTLDFYDEIEKALNTDFEEIEYSDDIEFDEDISDISISFQGIENNFLNSKFRYFHKFKIPLYNFNYVLSKAVEVSNKEDILYKVRSLDSFDKTNRRIICNNGDFDISISEYISLCNIIYNSILNEVRDDLEAEDMMNKMFDKKSSIPLVDNLSKHSHNLRYRPYIPNNTITTFNEDYIECVNTDFGMLEIKRYNLSPISNRRYGMMFLTRYTHTGTLFASFVKNTIIFGKGTLEREFKDDYGSLYTFSSKKKMGLFDSIIENNLSYHDKLIVPLCVADIFPYSDSLDINILCMVDDILHGEKDDYMHWSSSYGQSLLKIPLIFTDIKTYYDSTNDCYIFKMLLCDLVIPKSMLEHLGGSFNEKDNVKWWVNQRRKKDREVYQYYTKTMFDTLNLYNSLEDDDDEYEIELD